MILTHKHLLVDIFLTHRSSNHLHFASLRGLILSPAACFFTKIIKRSKFFYYVITSFFALESLVFFLKHYQAIYLHLFFEKKETHKKFQTCD